MNRRSPIAGLSQRVAAQAMPTLTCLVMLFGAVAIAATMLGCSQGYYRHQADADANCLIQEKISHPHWNIGRTSIDIDPRSRMFDPFDPDHPPMPADDPFSHTYMHVVDGKPGWPHWHDFGGTCLAENPYWLACLPTNADGCVQLSAEGAVRVALLHSVDYQQSLETLYLSALDVSAERFAFDAQFFNTTTANFVADGPLRDGRPSPIPGNSSSALTANNTFTVRKTYITGATFVANLANSFLWEFSGPNSNSALSVLDFTFIQPLLRNAGRERILETLTLAERTLLANVRRMQRFRQSFYIDILTGGGTADGPSRRGGFLGSSGLSGFTGLGSGGFGSFGTSGGGSGGGFSGTGAGGGSVGGYLGLLQTQNSLRNLRGNVARLSVTLYELKESRDASESQVLGDPAADVDTIANLAQQQLQVSQSQQALFDNQGRLLNQQVSYQNTLDGFKRTLGLPPQLCVEIADPMLDPFYLTDTTILPELEQVANHLTAIRDVRDALRELSNDARRSIYLRRRGVEGAAPDNFRATFDGKVEKFLTAARLAAAIDYAGEDKLLTEADPEAAVRLATAQAELRETAAAVRQNLSADGFYRELLVYLQAQAALGRLSVVEKGLVEEELRALDDEDSANPDTEGAAPTEPGRLPAPVDAGAQRNNLVRLERALESVSREVSYWWEIVNRESLESTRRLAQEVPDLQQIEIDEATAFEIARHYRLDWMDNRAGLVDRWRLIWFNADQLQSDLSLTFGGDIGTVGDNPIDFRSATGRLRVGVQFDPPITRLLERNNYRQSLIEYQQARRSYYRYVDSVSQGLRGEIRQIEANKVNYDIRLKAVLNAIEQVDTTELLTSRRRSRGELNGPTAARDTVSALNDLQSSLDNFLSIVLNYEALRLQLDFDLGTMELTGNNLWLDPGPITPTNNWSVPTYEYPLPAPQDCYLPYAYRNDVKTGSDSESSDDLDEQLPASSETPGSGRLPNETGGLGGAALNPPRNGAPTPAVPATPNVTPAGQLPPEVLPGNPPTPPLGTVAPPRSTGTAQPGPNPTLAPTPDVAPPENSRLVPPTEPTAPEVPEEPFLPQEPAVPPPGDRIPEPPPVATTYRPKY